MLRVVIITLFCFGWLYCTGQKIQNLNASFLDGKAIVTYDVIGTKANQTYTIDLYSSHNNFASPLKNVTGDVGKNIKAGTGKKIIWDAASELTEFSGDISFKIKGELIPLPLTLLSPISGTSAKRGKPIKILWEGGKYDQVVHFELLKGNDRVIDIGETKNTGEFVWGIPKKLSKAYYTIRISSGQETKQSGLFKVKSRTPLIVKILPLLAAGGAAVVLSGGGGGTTAADLPAAPSPK